MITPIQAGKIIKICTLKWCAFNWLWVRWCIDFTKAIDERLDEKPDAE